MSEELLSFLKSSLAVADDGVATFQWLSDEETAAIEQPDESEFTVQPWIEAQQDIDAGIGGRFGERSLLMRGLLEIGTDEGSGEAVLQPSDELRLVVDARRLGVGYILARAVHDGVRTARNNVLQPATGTFEELIDEQGIHLFSACTYRAAMTRLAGWALPDAQHSGAEMRTRISPDRWHVWIVNELGTDVRAVEVNLFLPGPSGSLEPETWALAHGHGVAVLGTAEGESLQIASMTTERLQQRLCERLSISLGVTV